MDVEKMITSFVRRIKKSRFGTLQWDCTCTSTLAVNCQLSMMLGEIEFAIGLFAMLHTLYTVQYCTLYSAAPYLVSPHLRMKSQKIKKSLVTLHAKCIARNANSQKSNWGNFTNIVVVLSGQALFLPSSYTSQA